MSLTSDERRYLLVWQIVMKPLVAGNYKRISLVDLLLGWIYYPLQVGFVQFSFYIPWRPPMPV
ncbi:hypothetical protein BDV23DRAFT_85222 [Aspergillus alliaceus]|uniref:Uncharacterized protein n=1 Tax=Petromyces alliaceus TaxID=209559 RepID=A0A5N7C8Q7_PETAA|nr:hypothetical protein BDV23DRAFT_85222 [Aspergillus alliaceus]